MRENDARTRFRHFVDRLAAPALRRASRGAPPPADTDAVPQRDTYSDALADAYDRSHGYPEPKLYARGYAYRDAYAAGYADALAGRPSLVKPYAVSRRHGAADLDDGPPESPQRGPSVVDLRPERDRYPGRPSGEA